MTVHLRLGEPFLSRITVRHGPIDLMGRFFLKANSQAEEMGLRLSFGSFEELLATNRANPSSWMPLARTFDPRYSQLDPNDSFCIFGCDADATIIASIAGRRYDWTQTTFAEEVESLRLFYAHPERDRAEGEEFRVSPGLGNNVRGIVGWTGAAWYHPTVRGKGLPSIFSRLARTFAYVRWDTEYSVGMMSETVLGKGLNRKTGHAHLDWAVTSKNSPLIATRLGLVWMTTTELIDDVEQFVGAPQEVAQASVQERAAH